MSPIWVPSGRQRSPLWRVKRRIAPRWLHPKNNFQKSLTKAMSDKDVIAKDIWDINHSVVPVAHGFELKKEIPICSKALWVALKKIPSREGSRRILRVGFITLAKSAWIFSSGKLDEEYLKASFLCSPLTAQQLLKKDCICWPLQNIEELLEDLAGARVFKQSDLYTVYWQVLMSEEFKEMNTFTFR